MTNFDQLGLAEPILKALEDEGHATPTPIQAQAIPELLTGRDLVGIAQTGTGKTGAFALPILDRLAANRKRPQAKSCRVLVLSPTRELAGQIAESFRSYGRHVGPSVALVIGGVAPGRQRQAMARGVDVLVATPGRLLDHVREGAVSLAGVEVLVLDEADRMLDMGFIHDIRAIIAKVPETRQTLLFSATMPREIAELSRRFLRDPAHVEVTPVARTAERIDQRVIHVERAEKPAKLAEILGAEDIDRAIVFTRTKHGADKVVRMLAKGGQTAHAIHGNKSQNQRERVLADFRAGKVRTLIATDIAARGIDVPEISHVINFDLPEVAESYVHRIGRTARAGAEGTAISFCSTEERSLLKAIEKLTQQPIAGAGAKEAKLAAEEAATVGGETKPSRGTPPRSRGKRRRAKASAPAPSASGIGDVAFMRAAPRG